MQDCGEVGEVIDIELVERIYEAAAIPEYWPSVLEKIGGPVGAAGGAIVSRDRNQTVHATLSGAYVEPYGLFASKSSTFHNVRPERAFARRLFGFTPDVDLCTIEELEADPIYQQILFPFGLGWTIGAPAFSPTADLVYFDFVRRRVDDPFGAAEAAVLDAYKPCLSRAALLATRLALERARATTQALSMLGLAGAVLDADGRVIAANAELELLHLRIGTGAFDRLSIADRNADSLFRDALLLAKHQRGASGSIPVPSSGDQPALILHLVPVCRSAHDVFARAEVLLLVTEVVAPSGPTTNLLSGLYDLTPAEAAVAHCLLQGMPLSEVARARGVSAETVRTQLKSLLAKTGTSRQVELVRLLAAAG